MNNNNIVFQVSGKIIEPCINLYFTAQVLLLLFVFPVKSIFFKNYLNWIDLISIFPFYIGIIAEQFVADHSEAGSNPHHQMGGLRVLRLIRLLRILKLFRHSEEGQNTMQFLYNSIPEFNLLLIMWSIGMLVFGPLLFFIESSEGSFGSAFGGR